MKKNILALALTLSSIVLLAPSLNQPKTPPALADEVEPEENTIMISLSPTFFKNSLSPNIPLLKKSQLILGSTKPENLSLFISQELPPTADSLGLEFPEFAGDTQECQAIQEPCDWVINSTYGQGVRIDSVMEKKILKENQYQRIPVTVYSDPEVMLFTKDTTKDLPITTTLKLNFPRGLIQTNWQTRITYTLVPSY